MKQISLSLLIILMTTFVTFSQTNNTRWLTHKLLSADTILLISHEITEGSTDVIVSRDNNQVLLPKLFINNKLNRSVVKEEKIIRGKNVDSLLKILTEQNLNLTKEEGGCFVARQSIIIKKGSKISYIDICFHCSSYRTSKDLQNIPAIDDKMWQELEDYFRKNGLHYELDDLGN